MGKPKSIENIWEPIRTYRKNMRKSHVFPIFWGQQLRAPCLALGPAAEMLDARPYQVFEKGSATAGAPDVKNPELVEMQIIYKLGFNHERYGVLWGLTGLTIKQNEIAHLCPSFISGSHRCRFQCSTVVVVLLLLASGLDELGGTSSPFQFMEPSGTPKRDSKTVWPARNVHRYSML